jgi:hypothetical protein
LFQLLGKVGATNETNSTLLSQLLQEVLHFWRDGQSCWGEGTIDVEKTNGLWLFSICKGHVDCSCGCCWGCFVTVSLAKETSPFCCYLLRVHNINGKRRQYRRTCENAKKFTASQRDASLRAQMAHGMNDGSVML